jgi:outer membrane protein TolC
MKSIRLIIFSILSLLPFFSNAQSIISPDDAIHIALTSNRDVASARVRLNASEKKLNQAWGDLMPTIESSASVSRQGAESGIQSMSDGMYDIRIVQLSLAINPGVMYNSVKIYSYEKAYAKEDVRRFEYQASSDAIRAYFSVIRASEMVKTRKDSLTYLKTNFDDVGNFFKSGTVPRYEVLQAEIQFKNAEPLLLESMNNESSARDMLNLVLGADNGTYEVSIDKVSLPLLKKNPDAETLSALTSTALSNRPEVSMLTIRSEQSKHSASLQQSMYIWPTFFLQGNYGYTQSMIKSQSADPSMSPQAAAIMSQLTPKLAGNDDWQKTWQVRAGATFRWNGYLPFDKNSQKEKEEELRTDEIALSIAQIKQSVANAVKRNYLTLKTAYQTIAVKKATITTAEEGLRIARESYREGIIKNSDLLNAEASLSAARASYIDALYSFYISLAELQRETGSNCSAILFEENKR